MRVPGVLPRRSNLIPRYSLGNQRSQISRYSCLFECKRISPWYCSQDAAGQKQCSSSLWPFLSHFMLIPGSGLGLWLHVMFCLQLSAFRSDTTSLCNQFKDAHAHGKWIICLIQMKKCWLLGYRCVLRRLVPFLIQEGLSIFQYLTFYRSIKIN